MRLPIKRVLIVGFVGLHVISVSIILASSFLSSQSVLLDHAKNIMANIAAFTIHEAQNYLTPARDATELTQRLADSKVVSNRDRGSLERYFLEQLTLHVNFAGIYFGTPAGEFLYVSRMDDLVAGGFRTKVISTGENNRTTELVWRDPKLLEIRREEDPADRYDPRKRPWYIDARAARGLIWTAPYIFYTSKKPGITTASPVFDREGNLEGVVGVDIEIDEISTFLSRLQIGKSGRAFILNQNGDVIAFPDASKIKKAVAGEQKDFRLAKIGELDDMPSRKAFQSLGRATEKFDLTAPQFSFFRHEGRNYHAMFAPFSDPQWPWLIGIYLPEDDYLGPIKANRRFNIFVAIGIAAAASLIGLLIARSITQPMEALRSETLAVKNHDLDTTYDKHSAIKEIQDAADAFTQMKAGLEKYQRQNAQLTAGLKHKARELERNEVRLRATLTSLVNFSDALIVLDEHRRVRFINPAAESLLQIHPDRIIGQIFPHPVAANQTAEIRLKNPNGAPIIAELRVVATEWEGQSALLAALRDVTPQRRLEQEIRARAETMEALHETALELATQDALPQLLRAIAKRAANLLGGKGVVIYLHRRKTDELERVLELNHLPALTGVRIGRGEGVAGRVLASGAPLVINDYKRWVGRLKQLGDPIFDACVGVPIRWASTIRGVLIVVDDAPRRFTAEDTALLERFTPLAAAALEQRRLLEQAKRLYARAQEDAATKSVLLKEVNHRVKNNLSAIIGLLYAERRHTASAPAVGRYRDTMNDLINRMQGLATVHSLLSASEWKPLAISNLSEQIIHAALQALPTSKRVAVKVAASALKVSPGQANNLAMVINEMATNSIKYAMKDRDECTIRVEFSSNGTEVSMLYRDDGPGYPPAVLRDGRQNVGLYLMKTIVEKDLRGTLRIGNRNGAVNHVRFPLEES